MRQEGQNEYIRSAPKPLCYLCGNTGRLLYSGLTDWLFGTPGEWDMLTCTTCRISWLDPQPVSEDIVKLYTQYYTHADNTASRPSFLQRMRQRVESAATSLQLKKMGYSTKLEG